MPSAEAMAWDVAPLSPWTSQYYGKLPTLAQIHLMTNFKRLQVTVQLLVIAFFAVVVLFSEFRTPTVRTITFGLVVIDVIRTIWVLSRRNVLTMTPGEIYRSGLRGDPLDLLSAVMAVMAVVLLTI